MDPYDPVLDQPQVIEFDEVPGPARYRLANPDLYFDADANSDMYDLQWPWANERYVQSIRMRIHDPYGEDLMTLVTRYYAGYQETILGNEGMIISKRLIVPLGCHYDRAAMWTLECQAEGDRLFRLDIEIDWGEPLTQRIVDGLLVAQRNPRRAQGIYKQRNADKTCVFGNPQGRPSAYEFDDEGHAKLSYYVLINGIVDVPLLLTVSDVGEQVAWSGFLTLRDAEREFDSSVKQWDQVVKTGRLWTSDPRLNRAVQEGRLACVRNIQHMRTGYAPTSRRTVDVPDMVDCVDAFDVTLSRNLLANLRRVAEKSDGRLPVHLPVRPKDPVTDPGDEVVDTNAAYLDALRQHMSRHPDSELLAKHLPAVTLCAETLVRMRWEQADGDASAGSATAARGLRSAAWLAGMAGDDANSARWESEANVYLQDVVSLQNRNLAKAFTESGWQCPDDEPWGFADPEGGISLAGEAIWAVSGLEWHDDGLWVYPTRIHFLRWWALIELTVGEQKVSLVWDGSTLHSTFPVSSDQPVSIHDSIRVRNTEEHNFDLQFELLDKNGSDGEDELSVYHFVPAFDQDAGE